MGEVCGLRKLLKIFFLALFLIKIIFISLFLAVSGLRCYELAFSSCGGGEAATLYLRCGFSLWGLLLIQSTGSRAHGLTSCDSWALGHRLSSWNTQYLKYWALGHRPSSSMESSWTRNRIVSPPLGRWILYHWATREALDQTFLKTVSPTKNYDM